MEEKEMNQLYKQFFPKLNKEARTCSNIYGVEFDDMLGQASLIFVECCNKFDVSKACFHTYLTNELKNLKVYAYKLNDGSIDAFPENIIYNELTVTDNYIALFELDETIQELSPLAQKAVEIAYNPNKLFDFRLNKNVKRITKKMIMTYLMKVRNYTRVSCEKAFYEIKQAL